MLPTSPVAVLDSSELSCDHLEIRSLVGREAIGVPFQFDLEVVVTSQDGPDLAALVGSQVTLVIAPAGGGESREILAIIEEAEDRHETESAYRTISLRLAPPAGRLRLVETLDVFLDGSVVDTVTKKLELAGLESSLVKKLTKSYTKREFTLQYRESDLAFVSRLCEHEGISIVFGDAGQIVLCDDSSSFEGIEHPLTFRGRGEKTGLYSLTQKGRAVPRVFVEHDYNYRTPFAEVAGRQECASGLAGGVVSFGSNVKSPEEALALAKVRAEEKGCRAMEWHGRSDDTSLRAGRVVRLEDHPRIEDRDLLVVEIVHRLVQATSVSFGGAEENETRYENELVAIDASVPFRPARNTPRPVVAGLLSGIVEGAAEGTELAHLDDQGRYRVRFLFDTTAPGERQASHPLRMAQPHAGPGYGMHFPLKPGVEVALGFINGDPDRPIIVGAVPNPATPSPVEVKTKTLNRIKTESGVIIEIGDRRAG